MVAILTSQVKKSSTALGLPHQPVQNGLAKTSTQTWDDPDKQHLATETQ